MKGENMSIPTMYTIDAARRATGLSYDYIRKLCLAGKIVYVRAGTKYLINMEKLIEYLNAGDRNMTPAVEMGR